MSSNVLPLGSPLIENWNKVFNLTQKDFTQFEYPTGFGASNGFYIILNAFEASGYQRTSKDFLISITNENNYYDILHRSFAVKPGQFYTFRVMTSQLTTTQKFDKMKQDIRNCSLAHESESLKFIQNYSRNQFCKTFFTVTNS